MKANYIIFGVVGLFLLIVGVVYTWITYSFEPSGIEWVGVPALFALAGMCLMVSVYLWMVNRRYGDTANDRDDAEVHEEAGIQGTFSPFSWAPLWTAIGCSIVFGGYPIGLWLSFLGFVVAMYGVVMWIYEFSRGHHAH